MNTHRQGQTFTLIELLVVIAIIAILASMLLPSLAKARNQARMIECRSQLKQLTTALMLYGDDYDGFVPPATTSYTNPWSMIVFSYVNSYEVYQCPVDKFDRDSEHVRTYSCNGVPNNYATDVHPFGTIDTATGKADHWGWRFSQIGEGSIYSNSVDTIALLGERPGSDPALDGNFVNTGQTRVEVWNYCTMDNAKETMTLHEQRGNFSFGDGHVDSVHRLDWRDQWEPGNIWAWGWGYH